MIRGRRARMSRWPLSAGVFASVFSAALSGADQSSGSTICDVISGPFSKSGSQVRLTLQGANANTDYNITEIWIGHAAASGNVYDFDGTQVQVKSGGAASFLVPLNTSLVTDATNYNFISSKNFIIAMFASTGACGFNGAVAGGSRFNTPSNTASVTAKAAGYATTAGFIDLVSQIEVFG